MNHLIGKMRKIKTYKEFSVNEELTADQRSILLLPWVLIAKAGQKLFDIYPFLNLRWNEMKKRTNDSKFDPIFGTGPSEILKENLTKIEKSKLPKSLKWATLLRNWNIYLTDKKEDPYHNSGRPIIYISKEELSKGDTCIFDRLSDNAVYPKKDKILKTGAKIEDPIIIMVAKYSGKKSLDDMSETLNDIWLEMIDDYPCEISHRFNLQGDNLHINIKMNDVFDLNMNNKNNFIKILADLSERTKDFLESEGLKFNYKINFKLNDRLIYTGKKDRFGTEIIPAVEKYSEKYHNDDIYSSRSNFLSSAIQHPSMIRVDLLHLLKGIYLGIDDIETLLSDMDNCYYCSDFHRVSKFNRIGGSKYGIRINGITIHFEKLR